MACYCGSEKSYDECCKVFHEKLQQPEHAEQVMRARYSAFATQNIEYILQTIHPAKREEYDKKSITDWSAKSTWHGFSIESVTQANPDDPDSDTYIEFIANYEKDTERHKHHERAEFRKYRGRWYFWDGKPVDQKPIRRETPKIGRNDPCMCGSGKKYKKCCGKAA